MKRIIVFLCFATVLGITALAQSGTLAKACNACCHDKCGQDCCQDGCTDSCCK